jgi:hypothetical protein
MPIKTSKKQRAAVLPSIPKEFIDQMVSGPMDAEAIDTASMAFKKALIERALSAAAITWATRRVRISPMTSVITATAVAARPS